MSVDILPIAGMPEVLGGDDLGRLILTGIRNSGLTLEDHDVVVVTQKVVSKAEGRVVPEEPDGKAAWVARETRRIVARRGDLVIAETRHGFVCANAGVDASNVAEGLLTLLPEEPDASAERIRATLEAGTGARLGIVITDTFGRTWRNGLVNVAIGCAGLPAVVDLRGTKDALGRVLEVTVVALADEIAAASGLVMGKAEGVPAAVVRGVRADEPPAPASALVRPPEEDLFPESPLQSIHAFRPAEAFGAPDTPPGTLREALRQAVGAACSALGEDATERWLFVALDGSPARERLLGTVAGGPDNAALRRSRALVVPCVRWDGAGAPQTAGGDGDGAAKGMLLSGGRAIQNLMLALRAQGVASRWESGIDADAARDALELADGWTPLGVIAVGSPVREDRPGRSPMRGVDVGAVFREL